MGRMMLGLALTALLAGGSSPAAALETGSATLCLEVEVPVGVTSVDAETATEMISSGEMRITDAVPCDGSVSPPPRTPRTDSSEVEGGFIGAWFVSAIRSGEADDTTAIAGMNAIEGISSTGEPVTLAVRCNNGVVDMLVDWGDVIEAERPVVTFELGSGRTATHTVRRSTDNTATFYPEDLVEAFLESISGESTLLASVERDQADPLRAVFDVARSDEALGNVWTACSPDV